MNVMPLVWMVVFLLFVGVAVYCFNQFVTAIDPRFKNVITAIVGLIVFIVCINFVMQSFGWGWSGGSFGHR